jgi:hypothetical protein
MQGVWTFASAAARDAAVTSPQEGNVCYLKDTDAVMTYSGSTWVAVGGGAASFSGCRAVPNTGQAISTGTFTALVYQTETYDVGGYHSTSSNTSRMTVPAGKAGYYDITGAVFWPAASGGVRQIQLQINGTTAIGRTVIVGSVNGIQSELFTSPYYLAVGDYVETMAYQDSGSTLTTQTGYDGNFFSMTYLGA